ncbi:hypothetical protein SKAU_G00161750 [Synaphobranchus kaupii]|uniref:Uncharacterized protein n=1 Tax=Synaphobranchus kaupii TaxID=118154 RepID=A0A9Q1FIN4_SYNKA|nr:hypothetical protein SKAU_G00161750 [Synaphobranchus kaupii]
MEGPREKVVVAGSSIPVAQQASAFSAPIQRGQEEKGLPLSDWRVLERSGDDSGAALPSWPGPARRALPYSWVRFIGRLLSALR